MKLNGKRKLIVVALIAILSISVTYAAVVNYLSNTIDQDVDISSPIALAGEVMYWSARQGVLGVKEGEAEFTIALKHGGTYSAHLDTDDTGGGDEARIVIPMPNGTTLGDIDTIAWWVYTVAGYPPHVDVILGEDIDGIENIDSLTAELACNSNPGSLPWSTLQASYVYNKWLETFELDTGEGDYIINGTTVLWVTRLGAGNEDAPYGTLADLQAGTVTYPDVNDPTITIDSSTLVDRLEIEVDNWLGEAEAYVDDVGVVLTGTNAGTYDYGFEPDTEDFNGASLPIYAGCYFDFVFDVENQANLPMDGKLNITITSLDTDFDGDPGAEFEDVTGYTFSAGSSNKELVLTADDPAVTFDPVTPVEISLQLELVPGVQPDTYTFSAEIVTD